MDTQKYAVYGLRSGKPAYATENTFWDDVFSFATIFDLKDAVRRYLALISMGTNMQILPVISMNPLTFGERLSAERIEELRKQAIAAANAPKAA